MNRTLKIALVLLALLGIATAYAATRPSQIIVTFPGAPMILQDRLPPNDPNEYCLRGWVIVSFDYVYVCREDSHWVRYPIEAKW